MKQLRKLLLFVSFVTIVFACNKEISEEIVTPPGPDEPPVAGDTTAWTFTEATKFGGAVDTGYLETLGADQTLTFEGTTTDGVGKIHLKIFGSAPIIAGSFRNPDVEFEYTENGTTRYRNIPSNSDAFTVEITRIDSASVTGTFLGDIENAAGESKTLTAGKFTFAFTSSVIPTEPPTFGDSCTIERIGYIDRLTGIPYAGINSSFNASHMVSNVVFYDSVNAAVLNRFDIRYSATRTDIDDSQYFELDGNGRIKTFHGYVDATVNPDADRAIISYEFDGDGYMTKASYAHESDPSVVGQTIEYTWTAGNLTNIIIRDVDGGGRIEIVYDYDLTQSPKSFLSFFPNYEIVLLNGAINYGKTSKNLLKKSSVVSYASDGTNDSSDEAYYENYVMDRNGYVQSFQIRGSGSLMQGDTKYTLSYHCR